MNDRRPPDMRTRMLRWLLAALALAAAGLPFLGHCSTGASASTVTTAASYQRAAGHDPGGHAFVSRTVPYDDSGAVVADCDAHAAAATAATVTATTTAQPPAGLCSPLAAAPPAVGKPRPASAVALTAIGVSRT